MRFLLRLFLVFLLLPVVAWGQTSVLNGNRVHAGWTNYGTTAGSATAYTLTFSPALPGYVTGQCFLFKPHVTNTGAATLNVQAKGALSLVKESSGSLVPLVAGDLLLNRLVQVCHDGTNLQLLGTAPDASSVGVTDGDKEDITVSGGGSVWTIDPGVVTYAKMQPVSQTDRLLGRDTPGAGAMEELTPAAVKTMLGLTFGDISGDLPYTALTPATAASRLLGRGSTGAGDWQEVILGTNLSMSGTTLNAAGTGGVADGDKGDITAASSGSVWTIDPDVVTYAKLQNTGAASILLGRGSAAGAGDPQEITLGTNLSMSGTTLNAAASGVTDTDKGDITVSSGGTVWTIDNTAVTYAKLQNVSVTQRLLGRNTAGAGSVEELTAATVKTMLGVTFGDISGDLPYTALTPATAASRLLGRGSGSAGDWEEVTLGTNLSMSGTTLNAATGGVTDTDKGDITVSSGGTVWTIDPGIVTYAKLQNVSTTQRLLGRNAAGAGSVEELTAATVKTMLGITFGDVTGTATDAQIPFLSTLDTNLTPSRCVETDATGKLGVAATPCATGAGSTGISGATNHGLMVATGGTTGSSLGVATNGQLPIGSTGTDPVLALPQGTANQLEVVSGAGSLLWRFPAAGVTLPGTTTLTTPLAVASGGSGASTLTGVVIGTGTTALTGAATSAGVATALTDETGSGGGGLLVFNQSPTLVTPTIASLANATHTHTTAAGGGQLTDAALSTAVGVAKGGTNLTTAPDDAVMVGNATTWQSKILPPCNDTAGQHLNYDTATNAFTCGTTGVGHTIQDEGVARTQRTNLNFLGTGVSCVDNAGANATDCTVTGAGAFSALTGGTNTTAAMVVGTGASLNVSGTGTVNATQFKGNATVATGDGGTSVTTAPDDNMLVGNGTVWQLKAIPLCNGANQALQYTVATNLWSCATMAATPGDAAANGTTKGIATFSATDFNDNGAGLISLDYTSGGGPETRNNKSTDIALGTSDTAYPSQNAVKNYVDAGLATKQNSIIYVPEDVAKKNNSATLGTSTTDYPTQGAVKLYVDSGVKAMTNTAITPRICTAGPASPIPINGDNLTGCDVVHIADLNAGTTTFSAPTGTPVNGQFFSISLYTATQRTLSFPTGTSKSFSAENGLALPTFSKTGSYVLYGFRYNSLSDRWAFVASTQTTAPGAAGTVQTSTGLTTEPTWQAPAGGLTGTIGTIHLPMAAARFPTTNFAVYDGSETNGRLLFDGGAISECAYWGPFRLNADYNIANTPTFKFQYSMTSATSGGVSIDVSVMTLAPGAAFDVNTEDYAAVNNCDDTPVPSVAGRMKEISCPLPNNDGAAPGRFTKIKLCRATGDTVDTATGDMEGLSAAFEYTR